MDALLNEMEVRVLGSLVEKQLSTPEYYPLSVNALRNACNQSTSRDPVVSYDESTVAKAVESLREKHLVWMVSGSGSRVVKYEHRMEEAFKLSIQELAVLTVLMLRGPQTVGEIRGRSGRLYEFSDLSEVELTLTTLSGAEPPLVSKLPRAPGTKEARYAHLFAGEVQAEEVSPRSERVEPAVVGLRAEDERIMSLENRVEQLEIELAELRTRFLEFKRQFE